MNSKCILHISDMSVSYGDNHVINNLDLSINSGELTALIGNNGCGKSTLIKAVMQLIPYTGTCEILNSHQFHDTGFIPLKNMSVKKRASFISYIPQRIGINMDMSVMDVCLMGYNSKINFLNSYTGKMKNEVINALEAVGLKDIHERNFLSLSEGQKQLCILARTLIENAPVMLLDEPDSSLDFSNKYRLMKKIKALINSETAALICIHDPALALNFCDRIILMKNGHLAGEIRPATSTLEEINSKMSIIFDDIFVRNEMSGMYDIDCDITCHVAGCCNDVHRITLHN